MKSKSTLRSLLIIASSACIVLQSAHSATLSWDGGTADLAGNGNGISLGTAGNWDTTLKNWDAGAVAYTAWNNANNDTAFIGGGTGAITLTAPITVGGLIFFSNSGNTLGGSTLTLGAPDTSIRLIAQTGSTSITSITSSISGTGNVFLSSINPTIGSTVNFNAGVGTGWSGSTTISQGTSLAMTGDGTGVNGARVLTNTSDITLNRGGIAITSANDNSNQRETARVSNSAGITSNSGNISLAVTTINSAAPVSETFGNVTLSSGQLNLSLPSGRTNSHTNLIVSDLIRTGTANTSSVAFIRAGTSGGVNNIRISSVLTDTPAGEIIGAWATSGNTSAQFDYAVYSGTNGTVIPAAIASSAQTTWTSTSNAYTADSTPATGLAGSFTLDATRNVTALKLSSSSTAVTVDSETDVITQVSHVLANGDAVVFNNGTLPTGLVLNTAYFVIDAAAGSYKLATTPGGTAIDFTGTSSGMTATGAILLSEGKNLGTMGLLNASTNTSYVAATGTGAVTLPSTVSGGLYVGGQGPLVVSAPITDNGTGVLTLVKNTSNSLTLTGVNTYTGGTVVNAGTLVWTNNNQLGSSGNRNLTVNGNATLTGQDNTSLNVLSVGSGGLANFTTASSTFTSTTGSGVISYRPTAMGKTLALGDANDFTGTVQVIMGGTTNTNPNLSFNRLGDGVGSALQFGGGSNDGNQAVSIFLTGGSSPVVFNERQIHILSRPSNNHGVNFSHLYNNNSGTANTLTINTDLQVFTNQTGRNFILRGSNTGSNAFNGVISDGNAGGSINITKQDAGTWVLGGNNTYSGNTTVTNGILRITHGNALGSTAGGSTVAAGRTLQIQGSITTAAEALTLTPGTSTTTGLINTSGNNTWSGSIASTTATAGDTSRIIADAGKITILGGVSLTGSSHQLVLQGAGDIEISGAISGVGRITAGSNGVGVRTLSSTASTYTGSTSANGGVLAFASIANVGATSSSFGAPVLADSSIVMQPGATLRYVGTDIAGHTSDRVVNLGAAAGTFTVESSGTGALTLSSAVTINSSGLKTLALSGSNNEANSVAAIPNGTGTNTTSLIKSGAGSWTLSGANDYQGATNINAGTLRVNGTTHSSSALTVNGTATLAGSGTIGGMVTATATANIAPGNATVGTLNISSDLNVAAQAADTGKLNFELASIASSDKIMVGGALTIGTEVLGLNNFAFSALPGLQDGTYSLITGASSVVGTLDPANLTGPIGGGAQGTLQFTGNNLELVVTGAGAGDPFAVWSSGAAFDADTNNDGVANGLAWLLGAANPNDNAAGLLPQTTLLPGGDLKINFSMRKSADRAGASIKVEHSSDLGLSDAWSTGVTVPETTGGTAPVTFTVNSSGALNVVEATISATEAAAGKLFARLKAER